MKLKCVIVDDDNFAIEAISDMVIDLQKLYPIEIIKTFDNAVEAVENLNNLDFNLLFVDFEMPGFSGIEIVKQLNTDIPVIFISSHTEKSIDITNEVNIVGFLTKPPNKNSLENIIKNKKLLISTHPKISKIIIPDGKKEYFFDKKEIYYVKSDGKYKDFYSQSNSVLQSISISFEKLETIMQEKGFERISKSYLINVNKIKQRSSSQIVLSNNKTIDIGESQKLSFYNKIMAWFK